MAEEKRFLSAADVSQIMECSTSRAYSLLGGAVFIITEWLGLVPEVIRLFRHRSSVLRTCICPIG